jgi:DNA-binding MarR family transcriptional regulator
MTVRHPNGLRDVTDQLGYLLRVAQSSVWRDLVSTFEPFRIRPQQYAAMARLEGSPGETLDVLAQALGIRPPNLVAMIEDLVSRGLVAKHKRSVDRRPSFLELTADGVALLEQLKVADDRHEQALADVLGVDGVAALGHGLRKLETFSSRPEAAEDRKRA